MCRRDRRGVEGEPLSKMYIGDAVYAQIDNLGRVVLTTEDGYRATNTIVLEDEVLRALVAWLVNEGIMTIQSTEVDHG